MVITYERAINDGVGSGSLFAVAQWHKAEASKKKAAEAERHYKIAADLRRLADKLQREKK